jgi:hypothetical protein
MTAELAENLGDPKRNTRETAHQRTLLPEPARDKFHQKVERRRLDDVRFPWTHSREPAVFHTSKRLPRKNHCVVP